MKSRDHDGYVFLGLVPSERPLYHSGLDWPDLGDVRCTVRDRDYRERLALDELPPSYLRAAQDRASAEPGRWAFVYLADVTNRDLEDDAPSGHEWAGYDVGEAVWSARSGFSILAHDCRPGRPLGHWRAATNRLGLLPTRELALGLIAERRSAERTEDLEPSSSFEGEVPRIYRIALHAASLPNGGDP